MNIAKEYLKSKGLRITSARVAVLNVLDVSKRPMDIATIFTQVIKKHVDADQATIYRIIESFVKENLVEKIRLQEKKFYYEIKRYDHHHAICQNCGKIEDIADCSLEKIEREIEKNTGFEVKTHSLEFFGLCHNCRGALA